MSRRMQIANEIRDLVEGKTNAADVTSLLISLRLTLIDLPLEQKVMAATMLKLVLSQLPPKVDELLEEYIK